MSLSLLLAGCASAPSGIPPGSDPSDPQAAEAPLAPATDVLAEPEHVPAHPAAPPTVSEQSPAATAQGAQVYACPMHPEITSDKPGRCPKCGMQMQPRACDGGAP